MGAARKNARSRPGPPPTGTMQIRELNFDRENEIDPTEKRLTSVTRPDRLVIALGFTSHPVHPVNPVSTSAFSALSTAWFRFCRSHLHCCVGSIRELSETFMEINDLHKAYPGNQRVTQGYLANQRLRDGSPGSRK